MGIQKHSEGPHAKPTDVTKSSQDGHPKIFSAHQNKVATTSSDGY